MIATGRDRLKRRQVGALQRVAALAICAVLKSVNVSVFLSRGVKSVDPVEYAPA